MKRAATALAATGRRERRGGRGQTADAKPAPAQPAASQAIKTDPSELAESGDVAPGVTDEIRASPPSRNTTSRPRRLQGRVRDPRLDHRRRRARPAIGLEHPEDTRSSRGQGRRLPGDEVGEVADGEPPQQVVGAQPAAEGADVDLGNSRCRLLSCAGFTSRPAPAGPPWRWRSRSRAESGLPRRARCAAGCPSGRPSRRRDPRTARRRASPRPRPRRARWRPRRRRSVRWSRRCGRRPVTLVLR